MPEPSRAKRGPWMRALQWPLFLILTPMPAALWVGLRHGTMAIPESFMTALWQGLAAVAVWGLLALALRSVTKAAVLIAPLVMFWFSFDWLPSEPSLLRVALYFALAIGVGVLLMRLRWAPEVVFFCNVLTLAWVLQPAYLTITFLKSSTPPRADATALTTTVPKDSLPHIVHIVLDGFPSERVLSDVHGIDNRQFVQSLEKLGFKVLPNARSNYGQTLMSIPSMYEMHTVEPLVADLAQKMGRKPEALNARAVRTMLSRRMEYSPVLRTLRSAGYRFVATESSYPRAIPSGVDERWAPPRKICEFSFYQYAIHKSTALVFLCEQLEKHSLIYSRHHALIKSQAEAPEIESWDQPTYFYSHVLSPHAPFIARADGSYVPLDPHWEFLDNSALGAFRERLYGERLGPLISWLSSAALQRVSEIIRRSNRPVVILLHGDHGTGRHWDNNIRNSCLAERFSPFVAVYSTDGALAKALPDDADLSMLFQAVLSTQLGIKVPLTRSPSYFTSWPVPGRQIPVDTAAISAPCSMGTATASLSPQDD